MLSGFSVDQKWKDSLKQESLGQGADYRQGLEDPKKGEGERLAARKGPSAGIHAATVSSDKAGPDKAPRKCKFAELTGYTGSHPPWLCKAFGDKSPEERNRIITDKKLCPICVRTSIVGTGLRPASFGIGFREPKALEAWECRQARSHGNVIMIGSRTIQAMVGAMVSHAVFLSRVTDDDSNSE
jgi:hypothetical protein